MFSVNIFVSIPLSGQKWMLFADDFSVEKRRQSGIFVRQAFDFEISAQVRAFQVDMLKKGNLSKIKSWIERSHCKTLSQKEAVSQ